MSYQVLARKWRPRSFPEMVGQEHVLRALINALDNDRLHHAFLFTGTRGVGKTTVARILAKSINCEKGMSSRPCGECTSCREIDEGRFVDLIEVDAASRTKVEDTRDLLDNVQYAPTRGRYKVYLIDEVHMLSNHSFNALLKTLEEPPPHVKFLLATTDPQKLPVTILSRCLQFNLKRLTPDLIAGHLSHVLAQEGIPAEPAAVHELARAADGSMRDALSLLDQAIAFGGGRVDMREVCDMLGSIDRGRVFALLEALAANDAQALLAECRALEEQGPDYAGVLGELASVLHRIALAQVLPEAVDDSLGEGDVLRALAARLAPEDVQLYYQIALMGRRDLPLVPEARAGFEMVMLRMLAFRPDDGAGERPEAARPQPAGRTAPPAPARPEAPRRADAPAAPKPADAPAPAPLSKAPEPPVPPAAEVREPAAPVPASPAWNDEPAAVGGSEEWAGLVAQLPLTPMVRQFAQQCSLLRREGDRFELALEPAHAHFRNEKREESLRKSLEEYLGRPVKLSITVGSGGVTPAMVQERNTMERQRQAEEAIQADPVVRSLMEHFDGRIPPGSIRPVGD
ncbi:MAG: DNA polymerase III subunit gamma/tau [Thiohalomonadaceae bacterium]